MRTRIERRRAQCGRWLLYPLIAVSAMALAGLATAVPPASKPTAYRVIQLSASDSAFTGFINARGQVAFTEQVGGVERAKFYDGNTVRDIGTLGGSSAAVSAINDLGQVTGGATVDATGSITHAYRWSQATGMVDLSRPGQGFSNGIDINNKGEVTGTAVFNAASDSPGHAFLWRPRTLMQDLGSFGGVSVGRALNDAGTVVGISEVANGGPFSAVAFRWTRAEGIQPLGTFPGPFTTALDINRAGHIVGATPFVPNADNLAHAFLWTPQEGLLDLGTGSGERSTATRLNDTGLVIGNIVGLPLTFHGFIWSRATGLIEIGQGLPETFTSAVGLNNRGQVVGGFDNRAYVWTRSEGIVDLNTRPLHAPAGLVLLEGRDINDSGAIVARANTGLVLLVPQAAHGSRAAPVAGPIKVTGAARVNLPLAFSATFTDADLRDTHKATWHWGDGSKDSGTVSASKGAGSVSGQHSWRKAGIYTVKLVITDSGGRSATVQRTVVVCGPGAVHAGQGSFQSPPGALPADPNLSGLASFSFVVEAAPNGRPTPAAILFDAPGLSLRGDRHATLRAEGARVEYRGSATLNGKLDAQFTLTATSGGGIGKDRIRMRIWQPASGDQAETVLYDNGNAASDGAALVDGTVTAGVR